MASAARDVRFRSWRQFLGITCRRRFWDLAPTEFARIAIDDLMNTARNREIETPAFSCLLVEDDVAFASLVSQVVREAGGQVDHGQTLAEADAMAARKTFDLILLDNHLPDGKAYDLFDRLARRNPEASIIMITGLPDLSEAISLTRNGLFDYLTKPVEIEKLAACLQRARLRMGRRVDSEGHADSVGSSVPMRSLMEQLGQAARHPTATVLLNGESGVGKDAAARSLHRLTFGARAEAVPYVALNCAAVPGDMFEAELFGAERGAYTGADKKRPGLVASAQGGTLFLDEIAEVPLPLQAKLLRFLEGREFRALGADKLQAFTGRVVAATNKSLHAEVQAGRFREDLLYRLEDFTGAIPPLRQRREDIPALVEHLLAQLAVKYGRRAPLLRTEDLAALRAHDFPGNIRELRNILERALLRTPAEVHWLVLDRLGLRAHDASPAIGAPARAVNSGVPSVVAPPPPIATVADDAPLPPERADLSPLEGQEYRLIRSTLQRCQGGIRRTAAQIGLSPQALLRRLEKWPELRPEEK